MGSSAVVVTSIRIDVCKMCTERTMKKGERAQALRFPTSVNSLIGLLGLGVTYHPFSAIVGDGSWQWGLMLRLCMFGWWWCFIGGDRLWDKDISVLVQSTEHTMQGLTASMSNLAPSHTSQQGLSTMCLQPSSSLSSLMAAALGAHFYVCSGNKVHVLGCITFHSPSIYPSLRILGRFLEAVVIIEKYLPKSLWGRQLFCSIWRAF